MGQSYELAIINKRPEYNVEGMSTVASMPHIWLGTDWHIGPGCTDRAHQIITMINKYVGSRGVFLYLVDFDARESRGGNTYAFMASLLRKIDCKNMYMIYGNNDGFRLPEYINLGFKGVARKLSINYNGRLIHFTHFPRPVDINISELNIHGHIHGSKTYWNIPWEGHYDVWDDNFKPIRLCDAIENADKKYRAVTVQHPDD